jgi:hypothetical protein
LPLNLQKKKEKNGAQGDIDRPIVMMVISQVVPILKSIQQQKKRMDNMLRRRDVEEAGTGCVGSDARDDYKAIQQRTVR